MGGCDAVEGGSTAATVDKAASVESMEDVLRVLQECVSARSLETVRDGDAAADMHRLRIRNPRARETGTPVLRPRPSGSVGDSGGDLGGIHLMCVAPQLVVLYATALPLPDETQPAATQSAVRSCEGPQGDGESARCKEEATGEAGVTQSSNNNAGGEAGAAAAAETGRERGSCISGGDRGGGGEGGTGEECGRGIEGKEATREEGATEGEEGDGRVAGSEILISKYEVRLPVEAARLRRKYARMRMYRDACARTDVRTWVRVCVCVCKAVYVRWYLARRQLDAPRRGRDLSARV
eukprot:GHVU01201655.1.p1 GENE.GHVU01201655.1~~GHVU01201655.1.p1  ORF type:complete len:295 (-),score=42.68 GHVU01201655.1:1515-2399(-)